MRKLLVGIVAVAVAFLSLTGCGGNSNKITIGTMSQPGEPYIKSIKEAYEAKGYQLEIRLFDSFDAPNIALQEGSIDANLFQHEPFLNTYNKANNTNLYCAAKLYDCVYGGYSKKVTSLEELQASTAKKVTIANDASNMKRCLNILVAEGLIEVNYTADDILDATKISTYITSNPYNLVISPIATSAIAPSLDDSDVVLGIVNATFAINAGLGTSASLICSEQDPEHVNANILACRNEDKTADWLKALVEVLTSSESRSFITETFGTTIIPYFVSLV